MIHTENITKKFGNVLAVDRLNLDVPEGEVFGFLGPNGAGKTTTVRMLASLISPTNGTATVAGFKVGQQDIDIRRNVGLLTETPGMYDNLSLLRQIYEFLQNYTRLKMCEVRSKNISKCWGYGTAGMMQRGLFQKE